MSSDITINNQIAQLTNLSQHCQALKDRLAELRNQMEDVAQQRDEELAMLNRQNESFLETELHRIYTHAREQQDNLDVDLKSRRSAIVEQKDRRIAELQQDLATQVGQLEERRNSETWVLQTVLDENTDDSPVSEYEREVDAYATQTAFLDDRFESLRLQIQQTSEYLAECHSSVDLQSPPPQVEEVRSRAKLQEMVITASDQALAEAGLLEKLKLPHWIRGGRLWGGCALTFILVLVPVLASRADLRAFINPELTSPDWQWLGVSSLIAATAAALSATVLVVMVQSRLRSGFDAMQQHVSNAEAARLKWQQRSEKEIDRMERVAEEWRQQVEASRLKHTERVQQQTDLQISGVRSETAHTIAGIRDECDRLQQQLDEEQRSMSQATQTWLEREDARVRAVAAEQTRSTIAACEQRFNRAVAELRNKSRETVDRWKECLSQMRGIARDSAASAAETRRWPDLQHVWDAPTRMPSYLSVADLLVTVPKPPDDSQQDSAANLCVELPAVLRFPADTSILVEHDSVGRETAISFIRAQILKLLTVIPPGRIRLTLIDPVGLGQSFSAMMHLADFDELLIHSRIWTDGTQIREQLQKVTEHMENVFQTYLRSEFQTIEEYNASAGEVAEPYHFVVIAGFPTAFAEESARHLSSILTSGPRCGVHALIASNPAMATPPSFDPDDLKNHCVRFRVTDGTVQPHAALPESILFEAYPEPAAEKYVKLVRMVGEASKDARRVEVSFTRIAPRNDEIWSHSTADGIDLPIGRAGAARLQFMRLGRGTSQHALVAGKTGSGKSTLLHILITNLALHYSPDEIQFYLIDFKKGVEFRSYAAHRLPHARVVAIESDREFGLSVLERLDEVLQERGDLFRSRGVQDVPAFREQFPSESMPRLLLLIDEFQEFFVAEDRVSSRASLLLDRLIRQGRAFGIHVLLGSQTLGGAYSLARSTLGQVAVRIALQCSESDAHLILSEDNSAARLLTRPGEAIYNDANGLLEGNHPFQIAWLDEARREEAIRTMLALHPEQHGDYSMVVFEGNVPPTVELCGPLNAQLSGGDDATRHPSDEVRIWLGEPVAIAAPTRIDLRRASGQNVLIVGQDESMADSILGLAALSVCVPPRPKGSDPTSEPKVVLLRSDRDTEARRRFDDVAGYLPSTRFEAHSAADCKTVVEAVLAEVTRRESDSELASGAELLLVIRDIGQFRDLRRDEDDFGMSGFGEAKPATVSGMFGDIIKRGPLVGVHVIVWTDTFSNAMRWLSNSLLREFEDRIAFRMNQTDSASLVDTPVASTLGPGRAVLYRDQTGTIEKFRPFAWPTANWLTSLNRNSSAGQTELGGFDIDSLKIE
ncbi:MAG: FtsK/SpoIIIE domain-containing protein [Planctomycetaceae bacterium]